MSELRDALDETVRALAYLWDASGLVDGFTVRDLFAEDDPIRGDVPAAILRARSALEASAVPPHVSDGIGGRYVEASAVPTEMCGVTVQPFRANCVLTKGHDGEHKLTRPASAVPEPTDLERLAVVVKAASRLDYLTGQTEPYSMVARGTASDIARAAADLRLALDALPPRLDPASPFYAATQPGPHSDREEQIERIAAALVRALDIDKGYREARGRNRDAAALYEAGLRATPPGPHSEETR